MTRAASSSAHAFAAALLDTRLPPPAGLQAWNGSDPTVRFAVHRNNLVHSLGTVLADTFPVVHQLVGDEFFSAMARLYVLDHPPSSPLMHRYGAGLPDWIADFGPAKALPYLPDIARLEWARLCAFHAADAAPFELATLLALMQAPQRLAQASLALHPSLSIVASRHPIVSLWAAHQWGNADRDALLSEVPLDSAEAALVFRDTADDAIILGLPAADASLTAAIAAAAPLGAAHGAHPEADLVRVLSLLLRHGLVIGVGEPTTALEPSP